jgi:hypothetical protein
MSNRFEGARRDPVNSMYCTELELHLFQWFQENQPNEDFGIQDCDEHSLEEHIMGYEKARREENNAYENTPEDTELMDKFLKIARADSEGQFEYSPVAFEIVINALTTFGL